MVVAGDAFLSVSISRHVSLQSATSLNPQVTFRQQIQPTRAVKQQLQRDEVCLVFAKAQQLFKTQKARQLNLTCLTTSFS